MIKIFRGELYPYLYDCTLLHPEYVYIFFFSKGVFNIEVFTSRISFHPVEGNAFCIGDRIFETQLEIFCKYLEFEKFWRPSLSQKKKKKIEVFILYVI